MKKYTAEETNSLALEWYNDKSTANANAVMMAVDKLCWWAVNKHWRMIESTRVDAEDAIQEARLGAWIALEKFDPEEGSYTGYAIWWINQRILRHIENESNMVKFPSSAKAKSLQYKYSQMYDRISNQNPNLQHSTIQEMIAAEADVPIETVIEYEHKKRATMSIDHETHANGSRYSDSTNKSIMMMDSLSTDLDYESTTNWDIDNRRGLVAIQQVIDNMPERKQDIAQSYIFSRNTTLEEIGEKYGITRQRVEQIVNGAKETPSLRKELIFKARVRLGLV